MGKMEFDGIERKSFKLAGRPLVHRSDAVCNLAPMEAEWARHRSGLTPRPPLQKRGGVLFADCVLKVRSEEA
jgi:hypothetical protein